MPAMKYLVVILVMTLFLYSCEQDTERLEQFEVHGIDVSHHQQLINWDSLSQNDLHFVFIKATEGEAHIDSLFCYNWSESQRIDLHRGAYHFFRPGKSPVRQAKHFIRNVHMLPGDLPPVLDVEITEDYNAEQIAANMHIWLTEVEMHYQIKPIIYTNLKFYHTHLSGYFPDYPIWIARYNYRPPFLDHQKPWLFWQYGNRGKLSGVNGYIDFNVFNGTLADLEALAYHPSLSVVFPRSYINDNGEK